MVTCYLEGGAAAAHDPRGKGRPGRNGEGDPEGDGSTPPMRIFGKTNLSACVATPAAAAGRSPPKGGGHGNQKERERSDTENTTGGRGGGGSEAEPDKPQQRNTHTNIYLIYFFI